MLTSSAARAANDEDDDQEPFEVSDTDTDTDEEIVRVEEEEVDDLSDSPNDRNDVSEVMVSEGHHSHLASGCCAQGNSKVRLPADALGVGESRGYFRTPGSSNEPFKGQKEVLGENHEDSKYPKSGKPLTLGKDNRSQEYEIYTKDAGAFRKVKTLVNQNELHTNGEARFCNSEIINADTTSPCGVTRNDVVITIPIRDHVDEGTVVQGSEEESSKMDLHLADDKRSLPSRSRSPMIRTRNLVPDTENDDRNKRPAAICDFFAKGWCIRGSSCMFLHVKDDVNITKDTGRESSRENCPVDFGNFVSPINRGSFPLSRSSLLLEYRSSSSGSAIPSNNYNSENPSSYSSILEEQTCIRSQDMHKDYSSPVSSHLISSLSTSGLTAGNLPFYCFSTWTGSLLPLNSSSLNSSPLGAQKLLESDRECRTSRSASLLRSSSPLSVSEPEKPLLSSDYKTKILSDDWEPSVPFQPSLFIPHARSQYDLLHESFDLPNARDLSLKLPYSSVGVSILNTSHWQIDGDSAIVQECNDDKSHASFNGACNENVLENACHNPGKASQTAGAEAVETSVGYGQNGTMPKGDETSDSTHAKAISKSKTSDGRHQNDGSRHNNDIKVNRARQNNEMDVEHKTERDVCKESKPMRHLRADLVDLIKELLKPVWREGHLSKDAHKKIVKKAVYKVLSALPPHQIPTTLETAKHYLSLSQPKIEKLVEGYVDKYGKS